MEAEIKVDAVLATAVLIRSKIKYIKKDVVFDHIFFYRLYNI